MVARVQLVDDEYRVVLSAEIVEALGVADGDEVRVLPAEAEISEPKHRYATVEEGLAAFRRTEHRHANTYRELAK